MASIFLDKAGEISIPDKADILTVPLMGIDEAMVPGDLPGLSLGQAPKGQKGMGQLILGQGVEDIALILVGVCAPAQQPPAGAFLPLDSGVVPGGKELAVEQ